MKFEHGFRYENPYKVAEYDEDLADFKGFWFAAAGSSLAKNYSENGSLTFDLDERFFDNAPTLFFKVDCTNYITEKGFIDYCNEEPGFDLDFSDIDNPDDEEEKTYYDFINQYFDKIKKAGYEIVYCEENLQDSWCFINPQKFIKEN